MLSATRAVTVFALFIAIGLTAGCTVVMYEHPEEQYYDEPYYQEPAVPEYAMFDELSYWGAWHWVEPFGWVWRPTVVIEWQPFSRGHWIWTEYGWMWVSYEPFGWATCHYGYWAYDFALGWVWIPGYDWYPHRVHWVVIDDYVCWAPAPAPGFRYDYPWYPHEIEIWVIVRDSRFTQYDVGRYQEPRPRFKSRYREGEIRYREPPLRGIERATGRTVRTVGVRLDKSRVDGHQLTRIELPDDQRSIIRRYKPREEQKSRDARDDRRYRREYRPGDDARARRDPRTRPDDRRRDNPDKPADDRAKRKKRGEDPGKERPQKKRPDRPAKQQPDRDDEGDARGDKNKDRKKPKSGADDKK